ncbi:MAG: (2Fe-2S)-binding protein [Clostridia bacterium]|nr:(2Fe-2S)-binding protein [Clostridia bacterium]
MKIDFILNGNAVSIESTYTRRLLDVIREDFDLTGTKEGCAEGECGACLVFMDDLLVNSCMVPMANAVGKSVVTIESFAQTEAYKSIENAFMSSGAVQCGYCTPGMVMAVYELFKKYDAPTLQQVKEGLSGNLCRCTGYQMIFEAVAMLVKEGYRYD